MNICLVSREYPTDDHAGGIGTYTEKTARGLARLGPVVHVVTETVEAPSTRVEDGVTVHRVARPAAGRLRTIAWARAVAQTVAGLPVAPDILQACEHRGEASWWAIRRPRKTRLVTRLATPSFLVQALNHDTREGALRTRLYIDWLERFQTYRSDAVISLTDALADIVARRWRLRRERITTILNGVDFADRYAATAGPLPNELRGKTYLLYFGRLEERKGVHILAQALPSVLAAYPNLHVVFAGNNLLLYRGMPMESFVRACNAEHRDRLHFFPRLKQRDLYPLLDQALVAVLPSLWEALGNVSLEALDMGKPVVATLGCGFAEVVEDGVSGVLVPPADVGALRDALLALLSDPPRLAAMALAAKRRARELSLELMTKRLLAFYETVLGRSADEDPQGRRTIEPTRMADA